MNRRNFITRAAAAVAGIIGLPLTTRAEFAPVSSIKNGYAESLETARNISTVADHDVIGILAAAWGSTGQARVVCLTHYELDNIRYGRSKIPASKMNDWDFISLIFDKCVNEKITLPNGRVGNPNIMLADPITGNRLKSHPEMTLFPINDLKSPLEPLLAYDYVGVFARRLRVMTVNDLPDNTVIIGYRDPVQERVTLATGRGADVNLVNTRSN